MDDGAFPIGWALGALILVLSIGISLFATDVFNVQVVIRKTIVYGALGLILVFLFAVLEEALINFLGNYFTSLVKYNSILLAGILAVSGSLIKKAIEPFVSKYLKAWIPD